MAEKPAKLRVAMGVFDNLVDLNAAVVALTDLGLEGRNLCLVTSRATVPPGATELWSPAGQTSHLACFQFGAAGRDASEAGFAARMTCLIAGALDAIAALGSHRLRGSHVWSTIDVQLSQGALLLAASAPSAELQNRAVRALLRYSPHPVHAEEFLPPAELS
jgi:hypothetical protein